LAQKHCCIQIKELDKKIQDAENADDKKTAEELVEQKRELPVGKVYRS
jgi:hypothetical protein